MNADAVSRLCLRCGLCCDGSLFTHIMPRGDELATLEARGAKVHVVTRRDGSCVIGLPCPALEGTRCTAYAGRPQGCRDFICATATQLAHGRVSEAEAAAVVDEAKRRIDAVFAALPDEARALTGPVMRRAKAHGLRNGPGPLRAAEAWLDEHFR